MFLHILENLNQTNLKIYIAQYFYLFIYAEFYLLKCYLFIFYSINFVYCSQAKINFVCAENGMWNRGYETRLGDNLDSDLIKARISVAYLKVMFSL